MIERLVRRLREWLPSAIFNPDRYAIQLQVLAEEPCEAMRRALECHRAAVLSLGIPLWPVVRAEVLTPAELAKDEYFAARATGADSIYLDRVPDGWA